MKVFFAAAVVLGVGILGMCLYIFLGKDFPKYDVGSNEEMRKRGIRCFKDEDAELHSKTGCTGDCDSCSLKSTENI